MSIISNLDIGAARQIRRGWPGTLPINLRKGENSFP